ncbi:MAG: GtrA family protein [Chitinophagaceae bacterium]|nr:MAG: GtrA family protein [Chitinophagaceae bacterium]
MTVFLKANVASLIASLSDYCITIVLVQLFHADVVWAGVAGTICGGVINFLIGRHWVFRAGKQAAGKQARRYFWVWAGNLLLNAAGMYLLTKQAGVHYILAKVVTSLLVAFGWNYPLQKKYVFLNNTKIR